VCKYENSANGDFLLDKHPSIDNVWLAGGGSGHGFKHGPAVGEYLAGRVLGTQSPEPRFSFASKGTVQKRSVYWSEAARFEQFGCQARGTLPPWVYDAVWAQSPYPQLDFVHFNSDQKTPESNVLYHRK
jgi:hypothetical protein